MGVGGSGLTFHRKKRVLDMSLQGSLQNLHYCLFASYLKAFYVSGNCILKLINEVPYR